MKDTVIKSVSEFAEVITGGTPSTRKPEYWNGDIPWLNSGVLNDGDIKAPSKYITELGLNNSSAKLMPKDTVLIALTGATTGQVGYLSFEATANQSVTGILPSKEHHPRYLYYFLKTQRTKIQSDAFGGAQPHINQKYVKDFKIPLPPLEDQIRIAHLLSKVEGLIAQRKQNLQQLDDLLKSVFLEMFGIKDRTYKRWLIDKLVTYSEIVSGVTKGKKYKTEELIETPYMRVANVQDGHFVLDEIKTIAVSQKEIDRYQLKYGDLLLTEGGDPDKLGRGSVWEEQIPNCIHQNHIFRVRIKESAEINPVYLSALVSSVYGKAYFLKSAKQTTGIASINSTQLKNFPTVIPPISLQSQFATTVEKVEGIKIQYQHSLTEMENLYGAISQKAFKGELDLSRINLKSSLQENGSSDAIEQGLSDEIKETLTKLNALNSYTEQLKTLVETSNLASRDNTQLVEVKRVVDQMAALRSPLQELKQMGSIVQTMEQAQVSLKKVNFQHMGAISKSVELARAITVGLPKINMTWIEQHNEAMRIAIEPFEDMRKAVSNIKFPIIRLIPFNSRTFEDLLGTLKGEVLTATNIWKKIQQASFENPPQNFEDFKRWLLNYLIDGKWLEQVYVEETITVDQNDKQKKIALRICDDS